jgi:hypothetical protein
MDNFFAPLRDLPMENTGTGREGNSTKHMEKMRIWAKVGHLPLF